MPKIYTIGHSNHTLDKFVELLKGHQIDAVGDVRSSPYSAWLPHFNRETLKEALSRAGILYVFLGDELGARRSESEAYNDKGVAEYGRIARLSTFQEGLNRVLSGGSRYRLALMCAEKDPLECHRTILVVRELRSRAVDVEHILEDGSLETQVAAEDRLMREEKMPDSDLFESKEGLLERAYLLRGRKIAYRESASDSSLAATK
jgi:uncharacterized protein (DUF488 family)